MSKLNYLNMMLSGYYKNPGLLKIYLIRQQQIAERDIFLSLIEFYDNCNIKLNNIKQQILKLYNERQKELYWILSKQKTENKDITGIEKDIENLKPNDFGLPLLFITNQQFTGHLYYSDIEFIENVIKQIIIYVDEKKDYTLQCNEGNFFYSGSENKLYTGRDFFIKIYLSKGNLKFPINFPDLIPKYYDLALSEYLTSEKNKAKSFFSIKLITIEFIKSEIEKIKILQNGIEDFINKNKNGTFNHKKEQLKYCKRYSAYLVEKLKDFDKTEIKAPQQTEIKKPYSNLLNKNWFKIGLLFANGEMDILFKKHESATRIAEHLGNASGFRPYITESKGIKYQTSNKSIFSNKKKMEQIISYCKENNINVIQSFIDKIPIE